MLCLCCAVIFLGFWAEVHYNSIYRQGGNPQGGNYHHSLYACLLWAKGTEL
jgi:hypothetical protein